MSLETQLKAALTRVATEINALRTERGGLANLTTTNKASIVGALNELDAALDAMINDASVSSSSETWSINQIQQHVQAQLDALVNGAGAAYNTLLDLANEIQNNDSDLSGILAALAKRVRVDAPQVFTGPEKQQARDNIDVYSKEEIGNPSANFVTEFETGLA